MNIYVGNMSFDTTEDQLNHAFAEFGKVLSVNIIIDRFTNKSKGFGFVEMSTKDESLAAISGLNGLEIDGRVLNINEAKPRNQSDNRIGSNNSRKMEY